MAEQRKVCLITGANSGIGKATALGLAEQGHHVVMVCRDARRGEQARTQIRRTSQYEAVDLLIADLSSQQAIRKLSEKVHADYARLHVLINNAGVMINRRTLTADGIEYTFAVNHLAYFMLAHLLLDLLQASAPARIVNVASGAALAGAVDFGDLMGEQHYSRRRAYTQSKLANVLFTRAMSRYTSGSGVSVNCLNPGNVLTNLGGPGRRFWLMVKRLLSPSLNIRPVSQAAEDVIALAVSPDGGATSGACFAAQQVQEPPPAARDEAAIQRLWQVSAELTQINVGEVPNFSQSEPLL